MRNDLFSFSELLSEFNLLLDEVSRNFSEPVRKTDQEVEELIARLRQSPDIGRTFYLIARTTSVQLSHFVRVDEYLPITSGFDADDYLALIHPDYIDDYLQLAIACYLYFTEPQHRMGIEPLGMSYRMIFPLKLKDNRYHSALMEVFPLQMDKENNTISHLNKYTILHAFDEEKPPAMFSELSHNYDLRAILNRALERVKNLHSVFRPTPLEKLILETHFLHPNFSNPEIALHVERERENINKQHKNILKKARESFPGYNPENIKEFVNALEKYGYFDELRPQRISA